MADWVAAWGMAHCNIGHFSPSYKDSTMRLSLFNNLQGTALRVRFCNKEGRKDMVIRRAVIEGLQLAFNGNASATLAPGAEICSDPVETTVEADTYLTISVAFSGEVISGNSISSTVQCSKKGDFTTAAQFTPKSPSLNARIFGMEKPIGGICSVEVLCENAKAIVCFGDSITQQSKWTEPLAYHLAAQYPGRVSLVNMAIGGNRLLYGPMKLLGTMHGQAGKERFLHDVLSVAGVSTVLLTIGTNDLGFFSEETNPEYVTAEQLIAEYTTLISQCRAQNLKVFGATILPRGGLDNFKDNQEKERQAFNKWILSCGLFDTVFDFDAAVRDAGHPDIMQFSYDSGDHLHPSAQGGMRLMKCILSTLEETSISLI